MTPTPLYLTGYEHGLQGAAADWSRGFATSGAAGAVSAATSSARNGSYGLHIACPANTAGYVSNYLAVNAKVVVRLAFRVTALPAAGTTASIFSLREAGTGGLPTQVSINSAGNVILDVNGSNPQVGPVVSDNNWHVVEMQADMSAATWTCDWKVDGVARTRSTWSTSGAKTFGYHYVGTDSTSHGAFACDYDDLIIGSWGVASTDWWGDGAVLPQLAGSDGTHSGPTNFSPGDTGSVYSGTVTTAYTMVDDPPGTGGWTATHSPTDSIAMRAVNTSAYMEIAPAATSMTGQANAVAALMSYGSSAGGSNAAGCVARNSAGTVTALLGTVGGTLANYAVSGSNSYVSGLVAPPAAGWTAAEVNAIRFRFGGGTNSRVSPVPTVQAMMLEADWPITSSAPPPTSIDTSAATATASAPAPTATNPAGISVPPAAGVAYATANPSAQSATVPPATATAAAPSPGGAVVRLDYRGYILAEPGLISYWRLGEASGNALDSKDSNPGTTVIVSARNAPGLLTGDPDGAVRTNGASGATIRVPFNANMNTGATLTVEFWINVTKVDNGWPIGRLAVGASWGISYNYAGNWEADVWDTSGAKFSVVNTSQPAGGIQHIVMTYDAAGALTLYVNGVAVGSVPTGGKNVASTSSPIDMCGTSSTVNSVNGTMDEVAIYNTALSPARILNHWNLGNLGTVNAPVSVFPPPAAAVAAAPPPLPTGGSNGVVNFAVPAAAAPGYAAPSTERVDSFVPGGSLIERKSS